MKDKYDLFKEMDDDFINLQSNRFKLIIKETILKKTSKEIAKLIGITPVRVNSIKNVILQRHDSWSRKGSIHRWLSSFKQLKEKNLEEDFIKTLSLRNVDYLREILRNESVQEVAECMCVHPSHIFNVSISILREYDRWISLKDTPFYGLPVRVLNVFNQLNIKTKKDAVLFLRSNERFKPRNFGVKSFKLCCEHFNIKCSKLNNTSFVPKIQKEIIYVKPQGDVKCPHCNKIFTLKGFHSVCH